mmetsp:Transcript_3626/g.5807  ORF Transcript_3626/g.5807 Transcript_3626/m.5807 type:complete len:403 (-) Transcript_3626:58-1266(-)
MLVVCSASLSETAGCGSFLAKETLMVSFLAAADADTTSCLFPSASPVASSFLLRPFFPLWKNIILSFSFLGSLPVLGVLSFASALTVRARASLLLVVLSFGFVLLLELPHEGISNFQFDQPAAQLLFKPASSSLDLASSAALFLYSASTCLDKLSMFPFTLVASLEAGSFDCGQTLVLKKLSMPTMLSQTAFEAPSVAVPSKVVVVETLYFWSISVQVLVMLNLESSTSYCLYAFSYTFQAFQLLLKSRMKTAVLYVIRRTIFPAILMNCPMDPFLSKYFNANITPAMAPATGERTGQKGITLKTVDPRRTPAVALPSSSRSSSGYAYIPRRKYGPKTPTEFVCCSASAASKAACLGVGRRRTAFCSSVTCRLRSPICLRRASTSPLSDGELLFAAVNNAHR